MANAYEPYYTETGDAPDSYNSSHQYTWVKRTKGVDITVFDNPAVVSAAYEEDTSMWEGDIELSVGANPLPLACVMIRIKNKTAGSTARYVITGYIMMTDYA